MLKVIVWIIGLAAVCCAQKHLICSTTDDVLSQQSPQTPQRAAQGSPGKRGPKGQMGSRGSPGQKGEPGVPDNRPIKLLRDQFSSLSQEVEALKRQSKKALDLIAADGKLLYVDPHFYIYQLTPRRQLWQESRQYCQNWGGDLAVHGVKTLENRKKLIQKLSINQDYVWVGGSDVASEGTWVWLNGKLAGNSELIWDSGQPQRSRNENYFLLAANPSLPNVGRGHDGPNGWTRHGICEKAI